MGSAQSVRTGLRKPNTRTVTKQDVVQNLMS